MAFSGGPDSLALLACLAQARQGRPLAAAIVDHALRPGSHHDAQHAAQMAATLGAAPIVRRLHWPPNAQPGHAAARRARYLALTQAARQAGATSIWLAHHADDQVETILWRAARGSGFRGLAGMSAIAPAPIWPEGRGLWLRRPFLELAKQDLQHVLAQRRLAPLDDPANRAPQFARARLRAKLSAWRLDRPRLLAMARRFAQWARAEDEAALAALQPLLVNPDGELIAPLAALKALPLGARARALSALIAAASGAREIPDDTARRCDLDQTQTLSGAKIWVKAGNLHLGRDPGAVLGRAGLAPSPPQELTQTPAIWDNRFETHSAALGWTIQANARGAPFFRNADLSLRVEDGAESGLVARPLAQERINWTLHRAVTGCS